MNELQDTIINWTNTLGNTYNFRFISACNECQSCKNKGFTREEASEILASKGLGTIGAEEALNKIYGQREAGSKIKNIDLYVVPTKYRDISSMVQHRLNKVGPDVFVSFLTNCEDPIVPTTARHQKFLLKIAKNAIEDPYTVEHLHEELEPYMEEAMLNAVLTAEQHSASVSKVASNQYLVEFPEKCAVVDLNKGESNGTKFSKSNFGKFGLADEFLIKAHDTVSPYIRLRKSLINR
jgi:hypothetical protein